ncbi:MAG: hypothetical protein RLZZ127_806 [Planctomycetota bacterium]|jgi:SulP family sulfate permease
MRIPDCADQERATAAGVEDAVHRALAERPGLRALVLACESVNELDATGCETLLALGGELHRAGIVCALAVLKAPVEETARRTGVLAVISDQRVYRTTDQAVAALAADLGLGPQPWDRPAAG